MANILLSDGEGLYPAEPEDAESPEIRAFMLLLENMDAVLNTVYLPGPIYSYVLPSQGDPDFMEGFEFSVRFDFDDYPQEQATWDKRDPEESADRGFPERSGGAGKGHSALWPRGIHARRGRA
ncbi:MAG TPA: hypothetical protein PLO23_11430 [Alphaproteobacteria bacterium]|nr:hypothetical protein [Alphaproteobacteria bacterium]